MHGDEAHVMRLFIGAKLSMASVAAIGEAVVELRRRADAAGLAVRWVAPATYHVTLKFLGEARAEVVPAVRDAVAAAVATVERFEFEACGLGAFPSPDNARVMWVGVEDPAAGLERLATAIDGAVAPLGFERERRPFHAHVTVGRLRDVASVGELLLPSATEHRFSKTGLAAVTFFESVTKSTGSEYAVHAEWPLGGG
jgi:2'-5' RNA ligase